MILPKKIFFIILSCIVFYGVPTSTIAIDSISELKWSNRIILVNSEKVNQNVFNDNYAQIIDRDIIWFLFNDNLIHSNLEQEISKPLQAQLKDKYFKNGISAVLIGKDGYAKLKQTTFNLADFLALIDTMPMRIQEMKIRKLIRKPIEKPL